MYITVEITVISPQQKYISTDSPIIATTMLKSVEYKITLEIFRVRSFSVGHNPMDFIKNRVSFIEKYLLTSSSTFIFHPSFDVEVNRTWIDTAVGAV